MINIHIIGNGTETYAVRGLLEVQQLELPDDIKVNIFGEYYFRNSLVFTLNNHLTLKDVIKSADIVICTDPRYEQDDLINLCSQYSKPLFCTFSLENFNVRHSNFICLDGLNVAEAASDMWINRLLDVTENLVSIEHFYGLQKLYDTGENALPGISAEEYQQATQGNTGQPRLITLGEKYYYASEVTHNIENDVDIKYNWISDTDHVDASVLDTQTEFLFHTVVRQKNINDDNTYITRSHMTCTNSRNLSAWHYINGCVVASFVHMYMNNKLPSTCTDYNSINHDTFSDNIFGRRFRIA